MGPQAKGIGRVIRLRTGLEVAPPEMTVSSSRFATPRPFELLGASVAKGCLHRNDILHS